MAVILCDHCGKRMITQSIYEKHLVKSHPDNTPDNTREVVPSNAPLPPIKPEDKKITLHFKQAIEVFINGKPYLGKDVEVDDMQIASEIVRIAKDAYGWDVFL